MENFTVPTREEVSENNQAIFDQLQKGIGMVPNLLAYMAKRLIINLFFLNFFIALVLGFNGNGKIK